MIILPFHTFSIHTEDNVAEVYEKLEEHVSKKRFLNALRSNKKLHGSVNEDGFKISRITTGRDSFFPFLHGDFFGSSSGTEVRVQFRPHRFVLFFLFVWCFGMCGGSVIELISGTFKTLDIAFVVITILFVILFFYTFSKESIKAKKLLLEIF